MKVAFSSFVLDSGKSGIATYIFNLLKHLEKNTTESQKIDVLSTIQDRSFFPSSSDRLSYSTSQNWVSNPAVNILWHHSVLPWLSLSRGYDLLHIPTYRRIPAIKTARLVATVHDLAALTIDGKYDYKRMFYNRKIVPHLIHRCDHIITVSHFTKQDIVRLTDYPEDQITVIYSGIDHQLFYPTDRQQALIKLHNTYAFEKPFFVYVSRLEHPSKNHVNLIRAFEEFKKLSGSDHQLILVGSDWSRAEEVHKKIHSSPVKEDILTPGFVPQELIPHFYSACDLMIYPSFFEGFGFPVIEAMACGARVACADTSSLSEIANGLANLFDPRDPQQICQAMLESFESADSLENQQKRLKYASGFCWNRTAQQVLDVYTLCLGRSA